eukprot:TRINITY_DN5596_c0_g1_i1.p1 TRINITY_DN5596_c0_g1~~TRINITY_DN5596_c0_g1_i1.p1  ORF type:complete len:265 (-),score=62.91 TRINITY_DN5596_c0_g1_i1:164-934(-)
MLDLNMDDETPFLPRPPTRTSPILTVLSVAILIVAVVAAVMSGLIYMHLNAPAPHDEYLGHPVNLAVAKSAIKAYRSGGEYVSDMSLLTAKWMDHFVNLPALEPNSTKTVIFDIDDTVLSSYDEMLRIDFGYIAKLSDDYQRGANMTAIPQTKHLYEKLIKLGYQVVYITGRKDFMRPFTITNLEREGLSTYTELYLRSEEWYHATAQEFKTHIRTMLVQEKGYDIVGSMGDQWSDISGAYTGYQMKVINHCYFIE